MTTHNTATDADILDDLIYDWLTEPTGERLRQLCAAWPAYARELMTFSVTHRLIELAPEPPPCSPEEEERLVQTGLAVVRRVIEAALKKKEKI